VRVAFIVPAYNEAATIGAVLDRIEELGFDRQVIVVDDGSVDRTGDMEYDPVDVPALIEPIERGAADVVFGSRLRGGRPRIHELPIAYYGRTYDEGKKITWRDGFKAIWVLLRVRALG
jgi:Glycosyl transferase family 2